MGIWVAGVRKRWAMKNRILLIALAILSIGLLVTLTGRAQDGPPEQPQGPPPGQEQPQGPPQQPQGQSAVGRLSEVRGQVSTMHGDGTTWTNATVNTPIVLGDKVSTADRARAEIQLDPANVMRLDQRTEAQVAEFQQNKIGIQLASGVVDFSVSDGTQADVEVDTPNMGVHPLSPGIYRIQVNSDSETSLIVRQGEAEVLTNDGSTKVEAGQMIQIHGTDSPEYKIDQASGADDFDRWCSSRDQQTMQARTAQPPEQQQEEPPYVGSSDLDTYGQWSEVPDEGWCWTPAVDAGWVPYAYGHWGYEPYFGWTWISLEPWGWAPYHYGSWFSYGGRWLWRPGRGGYGVGGGFYGGRGVGGFSARGFVNGRPGGNLPAYAVHSAFAGSAGRMGFGGTVNNWHGYSRTGFGGGAAAGRTTFQNNWRQYASPSPYGGGRQGYGGQSRSYYGGGYGGASRPTLNLNSPVMRQRAPSGGYYGGNRSYSSGAYGGGRTYAAPRSSGSYGGGRTYSAPSGGGHSYSAPRSSGGGGGGGGHASGGGGGHGGGHR